MNANTKLEAIKGFIKAEIAVYQRLVSKSGQLNEYTKGMYKGILEGLLLVNSALERLESGQVETTDDVLAAFDWLHPLDPDKLHTMFKDDEDDEDVEA